MASLRKAGAAQRVEAVIAGQVSIQVLFALAASILSNQEVPAATQVGLMFLQRAVDSLLDWYSAMSGIICSAASITIRTSQRE